MGPLSLKLALFTLIGLAGVAIVGQSAPANAANVICDGDCSQLDVPDIGDGSAFDPIVLGVETTEGDRRLHVSTRGNIYLVGPITVAKASILMATNIIIVAPAMVPDNVKTKTRNLLDSFPSVVSLPPAVRVAKTRIRDRRGKILIKSNGDLYIDVSETDLMKLKIKARGSIFVSPDPRRCLKKWPRAAGISSRPAFAARSRFAAICAYSCRTRNSQRSWPISTPSRSTPIGLEENHPMPEYMNKTCIC